MRAGSGYRNRAEGQVGAQLNRRKGRDSESGRWGEREEEGLSVCTPPGTGDREGYFLHFPFGTWAEWGTHCSGTRSTGGHNKDRGPGSPTMSPACPFSSPSPFPAPSSQCSDVKSASSRLTCSWDFPTALLLQQPFRLCAAGFPEPDTPRPPRTEDPLLGVSGPCLSPCPCASRWPPALSPKPATP